MINNVYLLTAPFTFIKKEIELSEPEDEFVTLKFLYCGVCGSDYSNYLGRRNKYPISLGHEFIAQIISLGRNVNGFSIGNYVVSDLNYRCNECINCREQRSHLCLQNDTGKFSNRAFADYANIHYSYLYKIPEFAFLPKACLIEPLSCVLHACEMLSIPLQSQILINGCGSIGTLFIFYLKEILHYEHIKILENNDQRRKNLQKYFHVQPYAEKEPIDIIIECSNNTDGLIYALQKAVSGQTICIMSHLYGEETSFVYDTLCKKELHPLFPLRNGESKNIWNAISYIDSFWKEEYNNMIGVYDEISEAFEDKDRARYNKLVIKCS